jgi:hypothetical protein
MARPLIIPVAVVGLLAAAALTGCSAGGLPGSSSSDPGSERATGSSSAPVTGGSGASFTLPTTCPSAADVATKLGTPAYTPKTNGDSTSLTCEYLTDTQDGPIIDIEPNHGLTPSTLVSTMSAGGSASNLTSVSGIGDAAVIFSLKGGRVLYVLAGKYTINVTALAGASDSGMESLAKTIISG